jgi:RNA polymerase sigma-B factor
VTDTRSRETAREARRRRRAARLAARSRRHGSQAGSPAAPAGPESPAPTPSPPDPRFAIVRASGDRRVRNELVEEHRWLAVHCARQFLRKGEPLDDLVQVAAVGIVKAVDRFDPDFGVAFATYAVPTVVGELRRHFRDKTWSIHVPRRAKELYQSVNGVVEELSQTLGRSPTVHEIAQRAGTTVDEAIEALEVRASYRGVPLIPAGDDERSEQPYGTDDSGFGAAEARLTVEKLLETLPSDRDRRIVRRRYIDGLTQSEIAAEVGVSQVQVSRLLRANLVRLRHPLAADRA